jgi:hypothetical protein
MNLCRCTARQNRWGRKHLARPKSGRARVPARREDGHNPGIYFCPRLQRALGFANKTDREDPTSPNRGKCTTLWTEGYVGQAAIPPGRYSARIRGLPVRRSQRSMLPTARSRPRKRGALHNQASSKSEGRRRGQPARRSLWSVRCNPCWPAKSEERSPWTETPFITILPRL